MKKRLFAAFVCLCMIVSMLPTMAFAEAGVQDSGIVTSANGLCEHHTEHTADCGYTEGTAEIPCSHEHTEDCYTLVTKCVHEHTAECYPAESVSENTATPSDAEEKEPVCGHVCSEESGCITKTLACNHTHDEACGYVPATGGTPCTFVCEICNAQDSGDTATPSDAQPEECTCETLCTGEEINADCPVCSAEGAELDKVCVGAAPMLPVTALAAGEHDSHSNNWMEFTAGTTTLSGGNYYLSSDVEYSGTEITVSGEVILCLNGHKLNLNKQHISVGSGASLTLCDCSTGGVLTGGSGSKGGGVYVGGGGTFTMTGGSIAGNTAESGGGVYVDEGGTFTMEDGSINNNQVTSGGGGGVMVNKGSFTLSGGSITGNATSDATYGYGGGVCLYGAFYLSGDVIIQGNTKDGTADNLYLGWQTINITGPLGKNAHIGVTAESVPRSFISGWSDNMAGEDPANYFSSDGDACGIGLNANGDVVLGSLGTITTHPQDVEVKENETATFTVNAIGSDLSYQWQQSTDNGSIWTDITGETNTTYTTAATTTDMSGYQYRCVVTANGVSVISAPATLTVNELVTYAITVHGSAGGTATADKTAAAAGETVTLTATPASGYHFAGWSIVSGTVTIQNNQFIMPAGNVEIQAVFDRNSSSGGSDSSYTQRQEEFWDGVKEQIRDADPGDTIKVNARSYDRLPYSVMKLLGEQDDVTLRISWDDGDPIEIPSAFAENEPQRVYYPLEELAEMDFTQPAEPEADKPETETSAGTDATTGTTGDTSGSWTGGTVTQPAESRPEAEEPDSEPESEPETEPESEPAIPEPDEETMTEPERSELPMSWILGGTVIVIAVGAGGFWFWKRRSQE